MMRGVCKSLSLRRSENRGGVLTNDITKLSHLPEQSNAAKLAIMRISGQTAPTGVGQGGKVSGFLLRWENEVLQYLESREA
jgi:hypothetical protein